MGICRRAKKQKRPEGKKDLWNRSSEGSPGNLFLKATHLGNLVSLDQIPAPYCFSPFLSSFIPFWPWGRAGKNVGVPRAGAVSSSVVMFVPRVGIPC